MFIPFPAYYQRRKQYRVRFAFLTVVILLILTVLNFSYPSTLIKIISLTVFLAMGAFLIIIYWPINYGKFINKRLEKKIIENLDFKPLPENEQAKLKELLDFIGESVGEFFLPHLAYQSKEQIIAIISSQKACYFLYQQQNQQQQFKSTFIATQEQIKSPYLHSINIGAKDFDSLINLQTENQQTKKVVSDLEQIGISKALKFLLNQGNILIAKDSLLFYLKRIEACNIPEINFEQTDYQILSHGVQFKEKVLQTNLEQFEQFIQKQKVF
jgi:hypothetical protein